MWPGLPSRLSSVQGFALPPFVTATSGTQRRSKSERVSLGTGSECRGSAVFRLSFALLCFVSRLKRRQVCAKLADYGLARGHAGDLKLGLETWQWLAPEGTIFPELSVLDPRSSGFGPAADIFSFGVVLWELLNGPGLSSPYAEWSGRRTARQLKMDIIEAGLRPAHIQFSIEAFQAQVSPLTHSQPLYSDLVELIEACWQHEPTRRPQAGAVVEALVKQCLTGKAAALMKPAGAPLSPRAASLQVTKTKPQTAPIKGVTALRADTVRRENSELRQLYEGARRRRTELVHMMLVATGQEVQQEPNLRAAASLPSGCWQRRAPWMVGGFASGQPTHPGRIPPSP